MKKSEEISNLENQRSEVYLNNIIQKDIKERQKEIADLESRSKQLYELVKTEKFLVNDVDSETYATFFTPGQESKMGGPSPIHNGGFITKTIISVSPENQDIPTRILDFYTFSNVSAGHIIIAQIPVYEEKHIDMDFHFNRHQSRTFYLERDFNPKEIAIKLTIFDAEGKILRNERSIHYDEFAKK